jgi:hypothetical protein
VRHVIAEGAFIVGAVDEGVPAKYPMVFLEGAFEDLAVLVLDQPLAIKQSRLELSLIHKLLIYKFSFTLIPITHKGANILPLLILKLLFAQPMLQIIPPLSRIRLIKILIIPLTMRKPILNIAFIITRRLNQPSVPRHFVVLPVALVIGAVLKDEDPPARAIVVLVVPEVGACLILVGALLVGVGLGEVGERFEKALDLEHFGV